MTDRISIPALRRWIEGPWNPEAEDPGLGEWAALVEAVEAAQRMEVAYSGAARKRLVAALARFDFGEET